MGCLIYGAAAEYKMDDRLLAHLKIAISQKLLKHECFFVNWVNPVDQGSGRVSIWVSPSIPLAFRFSGSRPPELNAVWVDVLADLSHSPRGMIVVSEEEAVRIAKQKDYAIQ